MPAKIEIGRVGIDAPRTAPTSTENAWTSAVAAVIPMRTGTAFSPATRLDDTTGRAPTWC